MAMQTKKLWSNPSQRSSTHRPDAGIVTRKLLRPFSLIALCILSFTLLFASPSTVRAASYSDYANSTASTLMQWYNNGSGLWDSTGWWNSANALTALIDYKARTGSSSYDSIINNTYSKNNSNGFINSWNDDSMWWGLAWERAYDVTGNQNYLNTAKGIANHVHGAWDNTCNGGLWNNDNYDHKDAITNELFLKLTAGLHNRISGDSQYLQWANDEWNWFRGTAMLDSTTHLVHNGVARDCSLETYILTYNQGVILGGLLELSNATGNSSYLNTAQDIANAATATNSTLVNSDGVLVEPATASVDDVTFKGVMMRNLYELWAKTGTQSYASFIRAQANALWNNDRNGSNQFGYLWQGPFDSADAARQQSALDTMNGAVGVGGTPSGGGGASGQQLFFDDFEGGNANQWSAYDGSWSVCRVGSSSQEYCGNSNSENIATAGDIAWTNYSVQSYMVAGATNSMCLLGRVQDGNHFYQLELKDGNHWEIWKNNGGSWNNVARGSFNWSANSYYLLKLDLNGNTLTASYSTDYGNSWNNLGSGNDSTWSSGKIGVRLSGTTGRFDQVKVISD